MVTDTVTAVALVVLIAIVALWGLKGGENRD